MEYAYSAFVQELIEKNDKRSEKYHDIFDLDLFEDEYEMDKDDFKNTTLKKECDVINKTLQSKAEALNEWKKKFYASPSQKIFDTCYNFISLGLIITRRWMKNGCLRLKQSLIPDWKK